METIVTVGHLFVSLALITLILIQHGKGADAGAAFGSGASGTVFGAHGSANFLSRTTAVLAALFFILSLALGWFAINSNKTPSFNIEEEKTAVEEQKSKPATPDLPQIPVVDTKPATPELPQIPVVETKPTTPEVPQIPVVETKPATPELPQIPVVETKPTTPEVPQIPVVETKPTTPEVPQTPVVETKPVTPKLPQIPTIEVKPIISELPAVPTTDTKASSFELPTSFNSEAQEPQTNPFPIIP